MTWGFKATNPDGIVQIDDTYANYALISKGPITAAGTYNINSSGTAPILAWSGDGILACHTLTALSGGTWTFTLQVYGTGNLTWYIFDLPGDLGVLGANRFGCRVWDASFRLIYDSRYRYMGIEDDLTLISSNSQSDTQDTTRSMVAGRKYAVTNSGAALCRAVTLGPPINNNGQVLVAWSASECAWAASGNVGSWRALRYTTRTYAGNTTAGAAPSNVNLRSSFFAIDVTNA